MENFKKELTEYVEAYHENVIRISILKEGMMSSLEFKKANRCLDVYSVAKTFTAAAVGILWDRGLIDLDGRIADLLEIGDDANICDSRFRSITVKNALCHSAGLARGELDVDVNLYHSFGDDFLAYLYRRPLSYDPGCEYRYSDGAYYLLSRVVEKVANEDMDAFLRCEIFSKLGIGEVALSRCPMGHFLGGTGLFIHSDDVAKFGALYASKGDFCGKKILSEEWVKMSHEMLFGFDSNDDGMLIKSGMYGQAVAIKSDTGLSVAIQSYGANEYKLSRQICDHFA